MTFTFHDIKHIVEAYLDDLTTDSHKRVDQMVHIQLAFEICRQYCIRLNPHKCIFYVRSGHILGFIVFEKGIMVEPMKVEELLWLPPSHNIRQL
jgi:hypothetical protein